MIYELDYNTIYYTDTLGNNWNDTIEVFPSQYGYKNRIVGDMILYIEKSKDSTKKLPGLMNEFSKVAGYKINTQKSVAFLYTNNELSER